MLRSEIELRIFWHGVYVIHILALHARQQKPVAATCLPFFCCIEGERETEIWRERLPWLGTSAVRQIKFKVIVSAGPARWRRLLNDAPNKSYDFRFLLVLHFFPPLPILSPCLFWLDLWPRIFGNLLSTLWCFAVYLFGYHSRLRFSFQIRIEFPKFIRNFTTFVCSAVQFDSFISKLFIV